MDFRCFDSGKRTEIMVFGIRLREVEFSAYSTWKTKRFFWRTRLRKTKGIFGVLALGNEKPKGTPDVWMMESKRTDTLWVPSDIGFRFRCSRIPKRKMFRYSKIPKRQHVQVLQDSETENVPVLQDSETENVQVLQDSETEKCLQVGCHWKVKMIRAGYLTLIDFGSLIDLEFPPSSFSLGFG
ncbi:unnamed protein product [Rhizophagus irregularis]|nr:unnamed protein product [Rhizophagus irregularis]